jgi:TetR/AcrR family fatty acid metabolism transcriptional regulator
MGGRKAAVVETLEEDRRRTILRAAVDVFAKKGYHGCRIADVAREAKVAYGLVYHYFHNKEELLQSVFELAWGGFIARVRGAVQGHDSLAGQMERICEVAFEAYHVDPRGVRVIILELARSPMNAQVSRQTVLSEVLEVGEGMFEAGRRRGELRSGLSPRLCANLMFGAVEMVLTALVSGQLPDSEEELARAREQLAESLLRGMLAPRALEARWKKSSKTR